jgi:hypothetical protein
MRGTRYGIVTALALLASCGEPTNPARAAGLYVMRLVEDDALPARVFENESVRSTIVADTLRLRPDGTGTHVGVARTDFLYVADRGPETSRYSQELVFRVVGPRVEIGFICPPNANCAPPPHLVAMLRDDGLQVEYAGGSRVPQRYERVP